MQFEQALATTLAGILEALTATKEAIEAIRDNMVHSPLYTVAPVIGVVDDEDPVVGEVLEITSAGTFTPLSSIATYQWLRDGEEIDDATATTYELVEDDIDASITLRTTLTGGIGTDTADSNAIGPVVEAP